MTPAQSVSRLFAKNSNRKNCNYVKNDMQLSAIYIVFYAHGSLTHGAL